MPIEIRELQIKVTVNQPPAAGGTPAAGDAGGGKEAATDKEKLIKQCIEQVLEIMDNKNER
jgi:BRCT domain type II-containing protein